MSHPYSVLFFFFNDTATTEIYTLSLHDALPISHRGGWHARGSRRPGARNRAGAAQRRRPHAAGVGLGGTAPALLVRAQERLPRGRPPVAGLLLHGRHHSAPACRRGPAGDRAHGGALLAALHERVSRR